MYQCEWENHWIDLYSGAMTDLIAAVLTPIVIFDKKKINLLFDFGCGSNPKSDLLNLVLKPKYRVLLDIAVPSEKNGKKISNSIYIKADMEDFLTSNCLEQKKRIANFIGLGEISSERIEKAFRNMIDIAIFSDILNYVNYKLIIDEIGKYIAKKGRVLILNKPGRGYKEFFSEKGVKSNRDLLDYIKSKQYYIIEKCLDVVKSRPSYGPWREIDWRLHEDDFTWILLILQKN